MTDALKRQIRRHPARAEAVIVVPFLALVVAASTGWAALAVMAAFLLGALCRGLDCFLSHGDQPGWPGRPPATGPGREEGP